MSGESDFSSLVESCSKENNGISACTPTTTDIWVNGTSHYFIWKYNNPFYVNAEYLNLYLYYIINYAYVNVKNYNNLTTLTGGIHITVDDSWFLSPSLTSQNLTMYGFLLPSTANVTLELSDPDSQYPRPFNFTVTQLASTHLNSNPNSASTPNSTTDDTTNNTNNSHNTTHNALPGWAIAVIVIAVIGLICGAVALFWITVVSRKNKKNNKLIPVIITPKPGKDTEKVLVDSISVNSQAPILACRSSESVAMRESSIASRPLTDATIEAFRSTPMYEEEEEMRRRRLGEALLQKQLEEDGTSVKHAGRFTHVKSLADIQKSAIVEQPLPPPPPALTTNKN
ncbi:hypothetical protein G6F46_001394 [Rhizopus delemar]|uniref:Uncharacterized protein n=3 Tax=Rhizopus TaxID=4842 RepID=I1BXN3_RHIO9|nr:hypothetical protein RO3G_05668 [Rhizopus delemar RA 99-880]KAG1455835.1 hypothetical protein G6F55_006846 [Rhizopus delemar]KAG1534787.1 hypothetical protein G6F51_011894 [Rhizopus arrhizus]KAG1501842.1 hypothetical protein G6F54_002773 [Rhizopus delemar]KAG1512645.1 hypothetical protein G6F52_010358 [Rhizopus delemar]|eukprot:EIE80963.1 hypothetical protein RO3G_05668 [Rhizopus delemar RA 99-880]